MATRSRIAIETSDAFGNKVIKSIYCHFDGYLSHNGKILLKNYQDRKKVEALIALGDISVLGDSLEGGDSHSFNSPDKDVVIAYHRDRGEDYRSPRVNASVEDFFNSGIEAYGYLFTEEGEWLAKPYGKDPSTLAKLLAP
jgi:hypothetical protein